MKSTTFTDLHRNGIFGDGPQTNFFFFAVVVGFEYKFTLKHKTVVQYATLKCINFRVQTHT